MTSSAPKLFEKFFTEITFSIVKYSSDNDSILLMDMQIAQYIPVIRSSGLDTFMFFITAFGNWYLVSVMLVLVCFFFYLCKKRWREIIIICLSFILSPLLGLLLKQLVQRERPPLSLALIREDLYAMPSNHALLSAGFYGMAFAQLYINLTSRKHKLLCLLCALGFIFLLGFSRIYLGVHWTSDVLIGYALGLSVNICLSLLHPAKVLSRLLHLKY
jgi:membrane-associated phospholipid phosphatase